MKQQNILKAITSAITHLDNSMKASMKKDEKKVESYAWKAASDLEYALFLFSLMHRNETKSSTWKPEPNRKQLEIGSLIVSTQNLLKKAESGFKADKFHQAHKKTLMARHRLLRLHGFFEKQKRREGKPSS